MKKLLLTILLLAFAFTGAVTTDPTDGETGSNDTTPPTEENTNEDNNEGNNEDYGVMPADILCDPWDCWGW